MTIWTLRFKRFLTLSYVILLCNAVRLNIIQWIFTRVTNRKGREMPKVGERLDNVPIACILLLMGQILLHHCARSSFVILVTIACVYA